MFVKTSYLSSAWAFVNLARGGCLGTEPPLSDSILNSSKCSEKIEWGSEKVSDSFENEALFTFAPKRVYML